MTYQNNQLLKVDSAKELVRNIPVGGGATVDELLKKIDSLQTELNKVKTQITALDERSNGGCITEYSPTSWKLNNLPSGVQWGRILHLSNLNVSDRYFILVDNSGKLYSGVAVNGNKTITWYEK